MALTRWIRGMFDGSLLEILVVSAMERVDERLEVWASRIVGVLEGAHSTLHLLS